jgi:CheY-like chemotaxis protein/HPt (histidine-containing phosphotransfer) domain-containing protein
VAAGEPYDIAILDMEMPGMDGLQLAREIRADAALARTPLVLLTSYAVRGTAELARQAKIDGYLTKPVRQSQLYDCLATVIGSGSQAAGLVTRHVLSEAQARARPRLLVAEDNTINQKLIVAMLSKLGYRADMVANGIEAVDAVFTIGYGTVLMDCEMPEMDGFQAAAEIRKRESGAPRTAIIAVTAGAMAGDRERCLAAGMDDYITKPIKLDELAAVLRRWTTGHDDGPDVAGEDTATAAAPLDAARLETLRSLQQEDQPDVLLTLMGPFLKEAPSQISMLRAALARDDAEALASVAHSLKGSATNLGAVGMGAICLELEAIARSGELRSGDDAVARLELELDRVIAAFTAELKRPSAAG